MKNYSKYIITALLLIISMVNWKCSDSFLESYPVNDLSAGTFFKNETDFQKAVNGIYDAVQDYQTDFHFFPVVDAATPYAQGGGSRFGYWDNGLITINTGWRVAEAYWPTYYTTIFRANEVLKHIDDESANMAQSVRNRLKGEALFLRAFSYFYIANFWGDAPLITTVQNFDEVLVSRDPRSQIIDQVEADLTEAANLLPSVTTYRGIESLLGRASKGAAQSLLGKVYVFEERWDEAEQILKKVIDSGDYQLSDSFIDMFWPTGENGPESIFEIQYSDDSREGSQFTRYCAPNSASGIHEKGYNYINPNERFVDLYETKQGFSVNSAFLSREVNGPSFKYNFNYTSDDPTFDPENPFNNRDPRLTWTVFYEGTPYIQEFEARTGQTGIKYIPGYSNNTNHNTVKYIVGKLDKTASDSPQNYIVLRYADVLLLYAEVMIQKNQLTEAVKYINMIRQRSSVNMPPISSMLTKSELTEEYRKERFRELAFEYGHIYLDMRRWDILAEETVSYWTANKNGGTNPALTTFDKNYYWWPIPENERTKNPNLTQNPGY
ncbi:MAG TPA: RagB/SusD family nutrient uptake outer membrane protein [Mariniphaga anaerophila]|uniref:RagB/SusD family nutrient uptake outer membrane protein n=1 Tax=Mariniphaga anaerophila TaxID=1484053 RepID=A0A831PR80_9BACT|nr:RagB/SusD family nutrient uptake outer membrane protein [Mariniphaga anaerophila]